MKVLTKYPIVSAKGNQYRVNVEEISKGAIINVFKYVGKTILFKRPKFEEVEVRGYNFSYIEHSWEYNYVELAKEVVEAYEQSELSGTED